MRATLAISFFLLIQLGHSVFAQSDGGKSGAERHGFSSREQPVVFGSENDGFPSDLTVAGKIVEVSDYEPACGILATAGTLKIKLDGSAPRFKDGFLYLLVFCLEPGSGKKLKNKSIKIEANKLTVYPFEFDVLVANEFDSSGAPFYLASGGGFGELKKFIR